MVQYVVVLTPNGSNSRRHYQFPSAVRLAFVLRDPSLVPILEDIAMFFFIPNRAFYRYLTFCTETHFTTDLRCTST